MINLWYRLIDFIVPTSSLYFFSWMLLGHQFSSVESWFVFIAGVLFVFATQLLGGYDKYAKRTIARKIEVVFKSWLFTVFMMVFAAYILGVADKIPQTSFVVWATLVPIIVLFSKVLINRVCLARTTNSYHWILLGENYDFNELELKKLQEQKLNIQYLAATDFLQITEIINSSNVEGIILNIKEPVSNKLVKFLTRKELNGTRLFSMNHFFENYLRKSYIPYDVVGVDYLDNVRRLSRSQYFLKRSVDISVAFFLFVISSPILIFSILKIRKQSPGSVFFKQSRVGENAVPFNAFKFRSMHENSHFDPYTQQKDSRIFPYGEFMRKTRIDEIPQLWNVLRSDMHLCGPRTEWDILVENYESEIPFYHERHLVKPGITGWAQVMYPYGANTEDARQKLMYDLYYIKHWSIWLEIEVLIRTVRVVLGKKGI